MSRHRISADWIFEQTMKQIAPLPCQEEYLRQLSAIVSFHLHRNELMDLGMTVDELPAPSAVVVAPTGLGKTFLLRKMAEVAHINCIIVDGSTLAAEGWRGVTLGQTLLHAKDQIRDDRAFERSILFFDEVDKIKFWGTSQDQGNPTNNLLSLYNGGFYTVEDSNKNVVNIDVRRFTVFLGGAFTGLEDIIRERVSPRGRVGFIESESRIKQTDAELMQMVTLEDLKKYGMASELLGRIGTILMIRPLEVADYMRLLSADTGSAQVKYHNYLQKLYGVSFEISEAGTRAFAERCMKLKTGARAVNPMINDLMRETIAEVERNQKICKVILDADEVGNAVRYEYGDRKNGLYTPKPTHTYPSKNSEKLTCRIRAKCFPALVNKLCRYYRNAGGVSYREPELQAFLNCALLFMFEHLRKDEHTFESLLKMVKTVERKNNRDSTFEVMVGPKIGNHDFCKDFRSLYYPNLQQNLLSSLLVIQDYMVEINGDMAFYFELKNFRK